MAHLAEEVNERGDLHYSEMKNPIYQALENQLHLEFEWAYDDKNLYSISWIVLHKEQVTNAEVGKIKALTESDIKKLKEGKIESFITTEFVLGLCFAAKVLHSKKCKVSTQLNNSLNLLLDEASKRNWLNSHEFASLIVYSLSGINSFSPKIREVTNWLRERYEYFVREQKYENAVDCLFGLTVGERGSELNMPVILEVINRKDKLSDEAIAKLCILLHDYEDKRLAAKIVAELERRLEALFSCTLGPSLERGLREVTGLLNSSCPPETVEAILETKRKEGQSWARDVEAKDREIIIKRIPELGQLPKMDPKTHALALKALTLHDRSSIVKLDKEEFSKLKDAYQVAKENYVGIRRTEYQVILVLAAVSSFFMFIFLPQIIWRALTFDYRYLAIFFQEVSQDWMRLFTVGPEGVSLFLWVWFLRILNVLRKGGQLTKIEIIKKVPIIGDIANKLLGEK
jgi:DNA-binding Xre family transcriptional regulator